MRRLVDGVLIGALATIALGQGAITGQNFDAGDRRTIGTGIRIYTPGPLPEPRRPVPTLAVLQQRVPAMIVENAPLQDVLYAIGDFTGVNLVAQWPELEAVGVARDTPISLRVRQLPVKTVLWLVMQQAALDVELAYEAREQMIIISTRDYFDRQILVRTYDVTDLVAIDPVYPAFDIGIVRQYVETVEPIVGNSAGLVRPIPGQIRSGVRAGDPSDPNGQAQPQTVQGNERQRRKMEELIRVIMNVVEPDHWNINGGPGSIEPFQTRLVIRASPLVHQMIGGPLVEHAPDVPKPRFAPD